MKETHKLLAEGSWVGPTGARFIGNVEGRDLMTDEADVVVTDGFTGNVALKSLEGALRAIGGALIETLTGTPEAAEASAPLMPSLLDALRLARPGEHRWRHAPRRRRGLHHQSRLVVGAWPW